MNKTTLPISNAGFYSQAYVDKMGFYHEIRLEDGRKVNVTHFQTQYTPDVPGLNPNLTDLVEVYQGNGTYVRVRKVK